MEFESTFSVGGLIGPVEGKFAVDNIVTELSAEYEGTLSVGLAEVSPFRFDILDVGDQFQALFESVASPVFKTSGNLTSQSEIGDFETIERSIDMPLIRISGLAYEQGAPIQVAAYGPFSTGFTETQQILDGDPETVDLELVATGAAPNSEAIPSAIDFDPVPTRSDIIRWGENGPEIQELSFEIKDESLTSFGSIEREMSPVSFAISAGSAKAAELYQAYYDRSAIDFDFFSEAALAGFTQLRFEDAKIAALEESSDGMVRVELIPQTLKFGDADADEIDVSDLIDPYNTRFDGEARAARYDETSQFKAFLDLSDYGIAARIPVDLFWFGSRTDESFDLDTGAPFEDVQSFPFVIDISDFDAIAGPNGSFIGYQELNARLMDLHQRLANDPALAESINLTIEQDNAVVRQFDVSDALLYSVHGGSHNTTRLTFKANEFDLLTSDQAGTLSSIFTESPAATAIDGSILDTRSSNALDEPLTYLLETSDVDGPGGIVGIENAFDVEGFTFGASAIYFNDGPGERIGFSSIDPFAITLTEPGANASQFIPKATNSTGAWTLSGLASGENGLSGNVASEIALTPQVLSYTERADGTVDLNFAAESVALTTFSPDQFGTFSESFAATVMFDANSVPSEGDFGPVGNLALPEERFATLSLSGDLLPIVPGEVDARPVEVLSYSFSAVKLDNSGQAAAAGLQHGPLVVDILPGTLAVPAILDAIGSNTLISSVTLDIEEAGAVLGETDPFAKFEMTDVTILGYAEEDGFASRLTLGYDGLTTTRYPDPDGGAEPTPVVVALTDFSGATRELGIGAETPQIALDQSGVAFAKFSGVEGNSFVEGFSEFFDIDSYRFDIAAFADERLEGSEDPNAAFLTVSPFEITVENPSTELLKILQYGADRTLFPEVEIALAGLNFDSALASNQTISMSNVVLSEFELLDDQSLRLELDYSKIKLSTREQNNDGSFTSFEKTVDFNTSDEVIGTDGDDTFDAGNGDDTIAPGLGIDAMTLGAGADRVTGNPNELNGDRVTDFDDEDGLVIEGTSLTQSDLSVTLGSAIIEFEPDGAGARQITLEGDFENRVFTATSDGTDTILELAETESATRLSDTADRFVISGNSANYIEGMDGDDALVTDGGADIILAGAGSDFILAGDGDDILIGGLGSDVMTGGAGADTFRFSDEDFAPGFTVDTITDFEIGVDRIELSGIDIDPNALNLLSLNGAAAIDLGAFRFIQLEGISLEEANSVDVSITSGSSFLLAAQAQTAALTSDGDRLIMQSDLGYTIEGGERDDTILSGRGTDVLIGGEGSDALTAGDGADTLEGGPGSDVATGGEGADIFRFRESDFGGGFSVDTITDFEIGTDRLELVGFDGLTLGTLGYLELPGALGVDLGGFRLIRLDGLGPEDQGTIDIDIIA